MKLDILFLCNRDYANLSYVYSKMLNQYGLKTLSLVTRPPEFYEEKSEKGTPERIVAAAKNSKIITFMHSQHVSVDITGKKVVVFHGGSPYRIDPVGHNKKWNKIVEKSIIQTGDLLDLGAKNQVWILAPIDVEKIKPAFDFCGNKLVLAHYPRDAYIKGSDVINSSIKNIIKKRGNEFEYKFSDKILKWDKYIKRMSSCDIYIEAFKPKLKYKITKEAKKYGEWGVTALEAACLGKVVISHFLSVDRYRKEFGECPIIPLIKTSDIEDNINNLLNMNNDEILQLKRKTREWVENNNSYKSISKQLIDKVYGDLL